MVHKYIHDQIPSYLNGKFIRPSKTHDKNARSSGELDLPIRRLKIRQRLFAFRGAKLITTISQTRLRKLLVIQKSLRQSSVITCEVCKCLDS